MERRLPLYDILVFGVYYTVDICYSEVALITFNDFPGLYQWRISPPPEISYSGLNFNTTAYPSSYLSGKTFIPEGPGVITFSSF
jgi:hypothetical protein